METAASTTTTATGQARQATGAKTTRFAIDESHTSVTFGVRHMMVSTVRGEFQKVGGSVVWNPDRPEEAEIQATIEVASINTREPQRDAHLRSGDFFDASTYPTIEFRSHPSHLGGVTRRKDGSLEVRGDLTIKDTTRVVTLEVESPTPEHRDPWGGVRIGTVARTTIKRSDFGITWNTVLEAGGVLVGDEIKIQLDVELKQLV
jgi:polyisoprenoid-binding protein YceI